MGPLFPMLLAAALSSLTAALPVSAAPEALSAPDPMRWDNPQHRDYFDLQRWLARLSAEGRVPADLGTKFETEASWSLLSADERLERIRQGGSLSKQLQDGGLGGPGTAALEQSSADREALVRLLGSRIELDPRMSGIQDVSRAAASPDEFKRFVEGSQSLPAELALRLGSGVGQGKGRGGDFGTQLAKPGRLSPGQASTPSLADRPAGGPLESGQGPDAGFFVLAFAATGFAVALGFGIASRRRSLSGGPPESSVEVPSLDQDKAVVISQPERQIPEPRSSLFKATPQHGAPSFSASAIPGKGSSLPLIARPAPGSPVEPLPRVEGEEVWDLPPVPPPAAWPTEGLRPAAWWAITKEEQALLDRWSHSPEKADGTASFHRWALSHPELSDGVDLEVLKDKLRREPS
ncbi:MAG: hypothetical protein HY924_06040 [Elusimicrobia bacterium]|nr:hypothetical protein [Elusimicrobiota bacterium]